MASRVVGKIFLLCFAVICAAIIGEYILRVFGITFKVTPGISQIEMIYAENRSWWGFSKLGVEKVKKENAYIKSKNKKLFYEPTEWFYYFKKELNKNPESYKIFCLGDSTTRLIPNLNSDINFDADYYPFLLEEKLNNKSKKDFIVVNCGISGYSTEEEVEFLEKKLLIYKPNLIVFGYCLNDKDIKYRIIKHKGHYYCSNLRPKVEICPFLPFIEELYINSELYKLLYCGLISACKKFNIKTAYFEMSYYKSIKALLKLKKLSKFYNFDILFVIFPNVEPLPYGHSPMRWIEANLKEIGFDSINMKDAFVNYGIEKLKLSAGDQYHFNKTGHSLIAMELFRYIKSKGYGNNILSNKTKEAF